MPIERVTKTLCHKVNLIQSNTIHNHTILSSLELRVYFTLLTIITMSAITKWKTLGGVAFLLGAMPTSISNVSLFYTQAYLWQWHKLVLQQYLIRFDYDCRLLLTITRLTMNQTKSAILQLEVNNTLSTLHLPDFFLPLQAWRTKQNQWYTTTLQNVNKRMNIRCYKLWLTARLLLVWQRCPTCLSFNPSYNASLTHMKIKSNFSLPFCNMVG